MLARAALAVGVMLALSAPAAAETVATGCQVKGARGTIENVAYGRTSPSKPCTARHSGQVTFLVQQRGVRNVIVRRSLLAPGDTLDKSPRGLLPFVVYAELADGECFAHLDVDHGTLVVVGWDDNYPGAQPHFLGSARANKRWAQRNSITTFEAPNRSVFIPL